MDTFDLTTRAKLAKTSGILLDRDLLPVFQSIENLSTRNNIAKGMLFSPTDEKLGQLKVNPLRFREIARDLIDFKLVAQVFEAVYDPGYPEMRLVTYFLCETESIRDVSSAYPVMVEKSAKAIHQFCKERCIADVKNLHRIAYNLSSGNARGFGTQMQSLFGKGNFIVLPPDDYLREFTQDIGTKLNSYNDLIGNLDTSLFYVPEEASEEALAIFRNAFESKVLPMHRLKNTEYDEKIKTLEDQESVSEKNLDYSGEYEFARSVARISLGYPKLLGEAGKLLVDTISKLSVEAEAYHKKKEKSERDRLAVEITKRLDTGIDLDDLFLRVNLEDNDAIPRPVLDLLKVDREILSAEWYAPNYKLMIFAKKKVENLKTINQIIFNEYKNSTDFILYFRALLESNEKDISEIFQDSQFVKTYGKSLQECYLRYIPFIYKIFAWLGIKALINTGYTKAKSLIKFHQMDRQFQYEKRYQKRLKERMEKRVEELAKKELEKFRNYLVNALEDFYFIGKIIPTCEEISNQYPALIPLMLEKVTREFHFGVVENGGFMAGNLIFFPNTDAWEEKNRSIQNLTYDILAGKFNSSNDILARAKLLKERLP